MHDDLGPRIGKTITKIREGRGMNKAELARAANMPAPNLTVLESGQTGNPGITTLARIAKALNVQLCALLTDTQPTTIEDLPLPPQIKAALSDPAFQEPLELALLLYEHNLPIEPLTAVARAILAQKNQ